MELISLKPNFLVVTSFFFLQPNTLSEWMIPKGAIRVHQKEVAQVQDSFWWEFIHLVALEPFQSSQSDTIILTSSYSWADGKVQIAGELVLNLEQK